MFPLRDDRPTYTPPVVTTLIIVACALVFLFELQLDEYSRNYFIDVYGVVPAHLRPSTLVTSLFLHGGWMHIIGNMLFLWAFGKSLEDALGHGKFLAFYLICGVVAGITHVFFNYNSSLPTVGASGAIAGVMGAYLVKFPRARIHTLVFVFVFLTTMEIPAVFILLYWFLTQLFSGYGSIAHTHISDGGVAWFAHIGGFITGMILVQVMGIRSRYIPRRDVYWQR
jgi:membrane associated rhomboid family serine protease